MRASQAAFTPANQPPLSDCAVAAPCEDLVIGVTGQPRYASAAACVGGRLVAFCELDRIARSRATWRPDAAATEQAVDAVLSSIGRERADILALAIEDSYATGPDGGRTAVFGHHLAHAATAYLTSPFAAAAVIVCDSHIPSPVSVWTGREGRLTRLDWPWSGAGFAEVYSRAAAAFGFPSGQEHRLEALARLHDGSDHERFDAWLGFDGSRFRSSSLDWQREMVDWVRENGAGVSQAARVASSFQRSIGDGLVAVLSEIRRCTGLAQVCLGGGLFYNTYLNTRIAKAGLFERVHVPPHPGNVGLSAGVALLAGRDARRAIPGDVPSPFLGPEYSPHEIKATLDNCKVRYDYLLEGQIIDAVVEALQQGLLVGWFQGRMEWGVRALGHRSILASPVHRYALENLNVYLKQREPHRTYGLSVRAEDAERYFDGPPASRYMEFDYTVQDPDRFRHVLPERCRSLRVQTVERTSPLFWNLHRAFADASGAGVLVNTSLNSPSEPIACSPRDAIRVFFGTGLDLLVIDRFVLRK